MIIECCCSRIALNKKFWNSFLLNTTMENHSRVLLIFVKAQSSAEVKSWCALNFIHVSMPLDTHECTHFEAAPMLSRALA